MVWNIQSLDFFINYTYGNSFNWRAFNLDFKRVEDIQKNRNVSRETLNINSYYLPIGKKYILYYE